MNSIQVDVDVDTLKSAIAWLRASAQATNESADKLEEIVAAALKPSAEQPDTMRSAD